MPEVIATKECVVCGKENPPRRRTCSHQCRIIAGTRGVPVEKRKCDHCGKEFKPSMNRESHHGKRSGVYCSRECYQLAKTTSVVCKCLGCGREFQRTCKDESTHWCSDECRLAERVCTHCGEWFTGAMRKDASDLCSRCRRYKIALERGGTCELCNAPFTIAAGEKTKRCQACRDRMLLQQKKAAKKRRKAILKGATIAETIRPVDVYERDGWRCQLCNRRVSKSADPQSDDGPSLDHIIPLSKGGTHEYKNVQLAHRGCNWKKSNEQQGKQLRLLG